MNIQSTHTCKKQAILKSAMELIHEHGFHGSPISQIAKQANVACGTIYHYFSGKDEVIKEIYYHINRELAAIAFIPEEDVDFRDSFFRSCRSLYDYYLSNSHALYFIEQFNSSPYAKEVKLENNLFIQNFFSFFRLGIDKGAIKRVEVSLFAPLVFGFITTTAKVHFLGRYSFSEQDFLQMITVIWDGIKLRPNEAVVQ